MNIDRTTINPKFLNYYEILKNIFENNYNVSPLSVGIIGDKLLLNENDWKNGVKDKSGSFVYIDVDTFPLFLDKCITTDFYVLCDYMMEIIRNGLEKLGQYDTYKSYRIGFIKNNKSLLLKKDINVLSNLYAFYEI